MKNVLITVVISIALMVSACGVSFAGTSDYDLAKNWMDKHAKGGHITTLNTTAKGGYKGKAKNGGIVKYPKKVKKGKKVKVYLVFKKGASECSAMVCLGKVK